MFFYLRRAAAWFEVAASGLLRRVPPSPRWVLGFALVTVVATWVLAAGGSGPLAIAAAAGAAGLGALALAALQREGEQRQRWDTCVEIASEWHWEMDADLRFTYLSPNFATATGIPLVRVIGRRREDLADAATRASESWHSHVADLAALRPFRDFAYDGRGDDGALRHLMISGKPVFDGDGRFAGYRGVGRDVTALQRAEGRLADAIQAMGDAFVLWDAEDRLVMWNHAVEASDVDPYPALHVGLRYEDILRARVKTGRIADAVGREEEYITERLTRRRAAEPFTQRLTDGRWVHVRQHRTRDGGLVVIRSDITDLKLRELELQRAEARLADAIEAMPEAFMLWDADGRLVLRNGALGRIDPAADDLARRGVDMIEFLRARAARGDIPAAAGREEAFVQDRVAWHGQPDAAPFVMELEGNRWLQLARSRTRDGGTVEIISDMTELTRRGAERARAESRLVDAVEALSDGFTLWDAEDRLVLWNSAARVDSESYAPLQRGARYADLMGESVASGRIIGAVGREEEYLAECIAARRRPGGSSVVHQLADGSWLRIAHHRTRDGGVVEVRSDITEIKQHEAELERAESRLTDAIEAMSDGFILYDADDRLVLWNSAIAREDINAPAALRRGITYEELMRARLAGGWVLDAIGREEAYLAERLAHRARADGDPMVRRLAPGRWMRVSERRTREGGLVVIRTDITELKDRELELIRARDEAQRANHAKSQFMATMSHELRTPLNAIIGFSDMMRNEVFGPLGAPRYAAYAADIHASGQHLLALINDVLDMSRIEAGRYELRPEPVSLDDVIGEAIRMVPTNAEDRGIALAVSIEQGLPLLATDRRALTQILVNLISNAVKFTGDGGRVAVSAHRTAEGGVTLAVADSGVGIAAERLAHIFEPFQDADATKRVAHQGAGLGLSICKRLADLQGLALEIASTVGAGTTATLRFPNTPLPTAA